MALRTNSKKARENVRTYIFNHIDFDGYNIAINTENFTQVAHGIIDIFREEKSGYLTNYNDFPIFIGLKPYDASDFETDLDFMEYARKQMQEYGGTLESVIDDYISECYEDDFANIETELNKHNFQYYHITIRPGYYEGFTLNIENNFPIAFDGWEDRKEANKEITEIKGFLIDCAGLGLVQCFPGWCPEYNDYKGTITAIKDAIKEMRQEVKTIPTWAQYERRQTK